MRQEARERRVLQREVTVGEQHVDWLALRGADEDGEAEERRAEQEEPVREERMAGGDLNAGETCKVLAQSCVPP